MSRLMTGLVFTLAVLGAAGPSLGADESDLAQGREALARRDYPAAVDHLKSAVRALDPARDAAALGDAWLQLGIAYLHGPGQSEEALPAFLASAVTSPEPSTAWLWASVAAEKLGRTEEALAYRTRALHPPKPVEAAPSEKPDAVQHFFGEEEAKPEPQDGAKTKEEKKVDAFEHFFGEKKPPS